MVSINFCLKYFLSNFSNIGSAGASYSIEQNFGQPIQAPAPEYGTPVSNSIASGHASSSGSIDNSYSGPAPVGHQSYGIPQSPTDFGPPESSYGPPPSGAVQFEDSRQGHAANIHSVQPIGSDLQLPEAHSNIRFNNDIDVGASALGVSAGNSEVIKAQTVHESHTSEVSFFKLIR